jgi:hypothetical protein
LILSRYTERRVCVSTQESLLEISGKTTLN